MPDRKLFVMCGIAIIIMVAMFVAWKGLLFHSQPQKPDIPSLSCYSLTSNPMSTTYSVVFSPDGNVLMACGYKWVSFWNMATRKQLKVLSSHTDSVSSVAISANGEMAASGSWDETVRLYNLRTMEELHSFRLMERIRSVAFSPNGKMLAVAGENSVITLLDVEHNQVMGKLLGHQPEIGGVTLHINSVTFSPDGTTLVSGSEDQSVRIWSIAEQKKLCALPEETSLVNTVAYSPNGRFIAAGDSKGRIRIWDAATRELQFMLTPCMGRVLSVTFSPDSKWLSFAGDGNTQLVKMHSDDHLPSFQIPRKDFHNLIYSISFSPNGKLLALGGSNGIEIAELPGPE